MEFPSKNPNIFASIYKVIFVLIERPELLISMRKCDRKVKKVNGTMMTGPNIDIFGTY